MKNTNVEYLVIGDIFVDVNIKTGSFQMSAGGVFQCKEANYSYGGSGNISAALSTLGISNCFIGKAGSDSFGELYTRDLEKVGVQTSIFLDSKSPTGILVSFVDDHAERSFIVARGANDNLTAQEIEDAMNKIDCKNIYITGYSLINSPQRDAILHAAHFAYKAGINIFFDIGAYNVIGQSKKYFDEILRMATVLSANAKEAESLSQTSNISQALNVLSKIVPTVVIRLGKDGCLISRHGHEIRAPAPHIHAVDSTGAGDAFNAALMYGMINNMPFEQIVKFANWFASKKVQHLGARSFPLKNEILSVLSNLQERR